MNDFDVEVVERAKGGSAECRRLRTQGLIPAVIYGHNQASLQVAVNGLEFIKKASRARSSQIFFFRSENKDVNGRPALVKEIQKDFVKGRLLHVDFLILRDDEEVTVAVPLHVLGTPLGVKNDGGVLTVACYSIDIRALPKHIPSSVEIDVTNLGIGDAVEAKDVPLPAGTELAGNPEEVLASVVVSRLTVTAATTAAEGDAAAATPAAGAAPAAAAAKAAPAKAPEKKGGK